MIATSATTTTAAAAVVLSSFPVITSSGVKS